jgi:diguanylate cyclase (GGDEF)-like protein
MPGITLTLQNRITTLMIISSVLFVSAFAFIQLNNQIDSLNRHKTYQANLSSIIVKNNLEATIRQVPPQDMPRYMQAALKELSEAKVISEAVICGKDLKIVSATEKEMVGEDVTYRDVEKIRELESLSKANQWFSPEIDKSAERIHIYIPLRLASDGPIEYIAKLSYSLTDIREALMGVYIPVGITVFVVILVNIAFGYVLSKIVIGPIKTLNDATKTIASGDLSIRTSIRTNDELQELGETFNQMTQELIKMRERAENANPLTKLPGNIVIREQAEERIKANKKFMVIYCDLDNFKAFNDKYGIAKGDDAIKLTADIFKEAVKAKGGSDDFIGHEGGDDFILLTTPDKAGSIANYITKEFDARVKSLYDQEDLAKGYIVAQARDGSVKKFPIMTISLAGVTNEHRAISNYVEITNIAAEIKKKAKSIEGSAFVIDKRTV